MFITVYLTRQIGLTYLQVSKNDKIIKNGLNNKQYSLEIL